MNIRRAFSKPAPDPRKRKGTRADRDPVSLATKFLFVLVCVVASIVLFSYKHFSGSSESQAQRIRTLVHRVARDEQQTCVIQKQGLPAGHALARVIKDIHVLVVVPQLPSQQAQQRVYLAHFPSKEVASILEAEIDLGPSTATYSDLESRQPTTRQC